MGESTLVGGVVELPTKVGWSSKLTLMERRFGRSSEICDVVSEASLGLKPGWFQLSRLLLLSAGDMPRGEGVFLSALFVGVKARGGSWRTVFSWGAARNEPS